MKIFCSMLLAEGLMAPGTNTSEKQGTWRLNAGSEMVFCVDGLNDGKPCRLVVDLDTVRAKNQKIPAFLNHDPLSVVGYWDQFKRDADGIHMDFHLVKPADEIQAAALPEVARVSALITNGVPVQISIGADAGEKGKWEKIEGKITVNGREYDGEGELPLIVLRDGEIEESSFVSFGADAKTGRIAAQAITTPVTQKGPPMSDMLKVLLSKFAEKHHGLVARCVAENLDESAITTKIHAADDMDKDAKMKAMEDEISVLKAQLADYAQKGNEGQENESVEKMQLVAAKGSKTGIKFGGEPTGTETKTKVQCKTMSEAIKVTASKHPTLKGFALRRQARIDYPTAEEK